MDCAIINYGIKLNELNLSHALLPAFLGLGFWAFWLPSIIAWGSERASIWVKFLFVSLLCMDRRNSHKSTWDVRFEFFPTNAETEKQTTLIIEAYKVARYALKGWPKWIFMKRQREKLSWQKANKLKSLLPCTTSWWW